MTIILPKHYHAQRALEENNVPCISEEDADRQDIRPIRIGILNIMPEAETYEYSLLQPIGHSALQISPVWIKLESHKYSSSDQAHLNNLYQTYEQATKDKHLDGMLVTGAPVETIPFEKISYWTEIKELLEECRKNVTGTMGLCWAALAMSYLLGFEKENYDQKLFGLFETYNMDRKHRITGDMDDVFWLPQSRHAGVNTEQLEAAAKNGEINLLASCEQGGYPLFESADKKFFMNLGHLEYNASRLVKEAMRDQGRDDVKPPENFDFERPLNRWRGQRNLFFTQWIKYIYQETPY